MPFFAFLFLFGMEGASAEVGQLMFPEEMAVVILAHATQEFEHAQDRDDDDAEAIENAAGGDAPGGGEEAHIKGVLGPEHFCIVRQPFVGSPL